MTLKGHEVNGVVTTGIYCRAGCAGRPKPVNTVRYSSNVAAEAAGFRPCLLCRPDRRTPAPIAADTPEEVTAAMLSIASGYLDSNPEAALAARVGLSARHLRRYFLKHVGATPDAVARSRRAHFARRLLDESDLPVNEIAYASGFRSVRQMNRVVMDVFRFPPSRLRARRREKDRLIADGGLKLRVPYEPPFEFNAMLSYLSERAIPGVESVRDGVYRRTISLCGHPGVVEVSDAGDGRHLELVAHLPSYSGIVDEVARCRRLFGLDIDISGGREALTADALIGTLVRAHPGLTVPGSWDRFETAVRIVVGQQVSVSAASTLAGRVAGKFGTPVPGLSEFGLGRLFPPAERLAGADLSALGLPGRRASLVNALARAVAEGQIDLYAYGRIDELVDQLHVLPGIGDWTASMIAMRVHGHVDAFPAGDLGLRRAFLGLSGSSADLAGHAERWRPWRALAAVHLWGASPRAG